MSFRGRSFDSRRSGVSSSVHVGFSKDYTVDFDIKREREKETYREEIENRKDKKRNNFSSYYIEEGIKEEKGGDEEEEEQVERKKI